MPETPLSGALPLGWKKLWSDYFVIFGGTYMVWLSFGRTVLKVCSYHRIIQGRCWRALRIHKAAHLSMPSVCIRLCRVTISVCVCRHCAVVFFVSTQSAFLELLQLHRTLVNRIEVLGQQAGFMMKAQDEPEVPNEKCNCKLLLHDYPCDRAAKMKTLSSTPWTPPLWMVMNLQLVCSEEWIAIIFPLLKAFGIFLCQIALHETSMSCSVFIGIYRFASAFTNTLGEFRWKVGLLHVEFILSLFSTTWSD